jgi:tRNA(Ile)-lysidine synthase
MDKLFLKNIKNNMKLSNSQRVIIAFSGGIDSICLLDLFRKINTPLIVAHFNHGIREKADRDERFAREISEKFGLEFVSEKGNVPLFAKENNLSLEDAARKKRYEFLFRIAREKDAGVIATGHHADDQVETMFMHLMRGSGLTGLTGMKEITVIPEFDANIKIIRPLLSFWRSEIEEYGTKNNLDYVIDETNYSDIYERNRIRNEILPYLNDRYPGLNQRLLNMTNVLQFEDEIIQERLFSIWNQIRIEKHSQFIRINKVKLLNHPVGIQRRIIRLIAFSLKPELRDLSFKNIENVVDFLDLNKTGEIDLQGNLVALFTDKEIIFGLKSKGWIENLYPQLNNPKKLNFDLHDTIDISENWSLHVEKIRSVNNILTQEADQFSALLDAEKMGMEIGLRVKRDGDRFQPLGMDKDTLKVSDIFINEKFLMAARKKWPIVTNMEDEIIWIPGFRLHHNYRITDTTKKIIKLSVLRRNY